MTMFETEHPIALEIKTISAALDEGFADSKFMPTELTLSYISPLETFDGSAIVKFSDAATENVGAIFIPVFSNPLISSHLNVMNKDGFKLTIARIKLADINGRDFPITIGGEDQPSEYIQFDVVEEGVIFSAKPNGQYISSLGEFESEMYDSWTNMAEKQGSIKKLHAAALMHLAA